ncbi:MAG: twin arginine-targeting protein translocase TatC [Desulfobacterales bacterium RIFOXYA12_FULL_46_15]|nr:MAG: twin arginine-targeting protein translocase TatC [Desulfobacula sp. GWF2_41_7]OGR27145.1 MAG: twin arginine-targeting protein translocase TatC [Desulfobacterales bacterium RIFOXYA12_FULL_46_15]
MTIEERSPFTEHLSELRDRLMRSAIAVGVGFCIAYFFKEKLFEILTAPLVKAIGDNKNTQMIFTGLPEAFFTYLKVSLITGIVVSTPVLFYEFWMFVSPGLYRDEKKYFLPIVLLSLVFFILGSSFGYFIAFPYGFQFFLEFSTDTIHAMLSMKEYLSFASTLLLAFGFIFELPLVLAFMARMGLVTVSFLQRNRKYAILIIFIVAAVLTPGPDVISQLLMAGPLMILYEIGIIGARIFGKKLEADANTEPDSEENLQKDNKQEES